MSSPARLQPHTVTFDCWSTLLYEPEPGRAPLARAKLFAEYTGTDPAEARAALTAAWRHHQRAWHRRELFQGGDMTRHALAALGIDLPPARTAELIDALESVVLDNDVRLIEGARELLESLARAGIRRALICDTGFSPGRYIRPVLERFGLLPLLETTVFSDEIGVPKPHPRAFEAALHALGVRAEGALHVGDLRRSDVAGARAVGMGSVRFAWHNDDRDDAAAGRSGVLDCAAAGCDPSCPRPEADIVVDSYAELGDLLGHAARTG